MTAIASTSPVSVRSLRELASVSRKECPSFEAKPTKGGFRSDTELVDKLTARGGCCAPSAYEVLRDWITQRRQTVIDMGGSRRITLMGWPDLGISGAASLVEVARVATEENDLLFCSPGALIDLVAFVATQDRLFTAVVPLWVPGVQPGEGRLLSAALHVIKHRDYVSVCGMNADHPVRPSSRFTFDATDSMLRFA